jgi:hypothetical protein
MGFDIYKQAKEANADYYDYHTGYTYRIQDYNAGLTPLGIAVWEDNTYIGYVPVPADTSVKEEVDS